MKAQSIHRTLMGIAAIALVLLIGSPYVAAQKADSEEISNLLTQSKTHAVQAEDDSATLESFTRSGLEWRSHAAKLDQIKTHVNEIGKLLKQMSDLNAEGSPWQQEAIRQIDPLLRSMADNLTSTIDHLNKNQNKVHLPPYRDYVHANYEFASRTAEMIKDFVDYDKAKAKADALEQKLELPVSDQGD